MSLETSNASDVTKLSHSLHRLKNTSEFMMVNDRIHVLIMDAIKVLPRCPTSLDIKRSTRGINNSDVLIVLKNLLLRATLNSMFKFMTRIDQTIDVKLRDARIHTSTLVPSRNIFKPLILKSLNGILKCANQLRL